MARNIYKRINHVSCDMMTTSIENDPAPRTTWIEKVTHLANNSKKMQSLSLKDRIVLVDALLEHAQCLADESLYRNDLAVMKLGPLLENSRDLCKFKYSRDVNYLLGLNKFGAIALVVTSLKSIKESLEYQMVLQNGKNGNRKIPHMLKNVKTETIAGRKINVYGPVEVWPMFHKLEVWADADVNNTAAETRPSNNMESLSINEVDNKEAGIALVLGAGNQSFITIMDTLQCIFYHPCKPVLIKHHPLRSHLYSVCSELFAPLIELGYLDQITDGGVEEIQQILEHPSISHVHVTGALSTANAIQSKLAESRPHMSMQDVENMVTSELGCATPWIIVPGKYSQRELNMAAKHIVTGKKFNAGCNCLCSQVVILPHGWDQKDEFKEILFQKIKDIPTDPLYYPGSLKRLYHIVEQYSPNTVQKITSKIINRDIDGDASDFVQTHVVDCGVYGTDSFNDYAVKNEAFGPLLALMELSGDVDDQNYLMNTVIPFVNNKKNIYGSLSCSLVHPKHYNFDLIREATAALNYGCVALNTWSFYGYFGIAYGGTWGGSKYDATGASGRGFIGNYFFIPNIQKTVVHSRTLTFPLIVDKTLVVPKLLFDFASGFFLRRNIMTTVRKIIKKFRDKCKHLSMPFSVK